MNYKKYKQRLFISIVIILLMLIIGFTNRGIQSVNIIDRFVGDLVSPIISVTSRSVNRLSDGVNTILNIPTLITENQSLKTENISLKDENLVLSDIIARSDYLRNEYELINNTNFNVVKANIIGKAQELNDKYLIDKGSLNGINNNDTVIVGIQSSENVVVEGLVGKVEEVGDNWSKISLITEENNSISFTNVRTQEGGIIDQTDGSILEGFMFNSQSDIIADDRIYTSGLGEIYAPRIYIGRVSNVINDEEDLRKNITIVPAVEFDKLNSVMVILGEDYD